MARPPAGVPSRSKARPFGPIGSQGSWSGPGTRLSDSSKSVTPYREKVQPRLVRDGIASLPIEHAHALYVCRLPPHHRDPFDRLLLSQASVENIPLLTADRALEAYGVSLLFAKA